MNNDKNNCLPSKMIEQAYYRILSDKKGRLSRHN